MFAELDLTKIYGAEMTPMKKLEELFRFITINTPHFRFWSGPKFPIFFIDEANKMDNLTKTDIGGEGESPIKGRPIYMYTYFLTSKSLSFSIFFGM